MLTSESALRKDRLGLAPYLDHAGKVCLRERGE